MKFLQAFRGALLGLAGGLTVFAFAFGVPESIEASALSVDPSPQPQVVRITLEEARLNR